MIETIIFSRPAKAAISFNNWAKSGFHLVKQEIFEQIVTCGINLLLEIQENAKNAVVLHGQN